MPTYSNTPPPNPTGAALPILRTPAGSKLRGIITSSDIVGTNTHFWGGHTVPCGYPECEACSKGVPYRWHAYLTACQPQKALHFLFEMTAAAASVVCDFRRQNGNLRGYEFEAFRWHQNPNGRVMLRINPSKNGSICLPAEPDLKAVLAILWQLPKDNLQTLEARGLAAEMQIDTTFPIHRDHLNDEEPPNREAV